MSPMEFDAGRSARREAARLLERLAVPMSRREMLRCCLYGAGGLFLLNGWGLRAAVPRRGSRARSVIQVWLWGGPCHIDLFDPKPEAGRDFCGPLNSAVETNVSGIRIGQLLPRLARQADKYALIRSLTHGSNAHETASYIVQTGHNPGGRDVFPSAGAVVAHFKGGTRDERGLLPPYIVLTEPQGRFSESGFLGYAAKPFVTGGDPARPRFEVEGIVAPGISEARQRQRRALLAELNTLGRVLPGDATLQTFYASEQQAYELILGEAGRLFDLNREPEAVRDRYGRNTFGQSCLMARRLVEQGVPYVTINYKGWDTHKQHFQAMNRKLPELDQGLSALLEDLAARGLLSETIVWVSGEFGRTPRVQWDPPWNGGRNHFGRAFSALVAGGGFKGGQVLGATNATGEEVVERPVHPAEVLASIYTLLGIDPGATLPHPEGQPVRVLPEAVGHGGSLRLLHEIMETV
ncbi:MAG: sulfatase [Limisphaera sp.]|nr:MAG: sulfatase [Limisphaera sp.]